MGRGFATGFLSGVHAARAGIDTYYRAQDREKQEAREKEMREAVESQPVQGEGFTAEQGQQLEAAAQSGQYDIGYDQEKKAYTVTPKADPSQTGLIAQQGVTDFLGERKAGTMAPAEIEAARSKAIVNVVKKQNPTEGIRLEREVRQGAREAKADENAAMLETIDREVGEWSKQRLTNPDGTTRDMTVDDQLATGQYRVSRLIAAGRLNEANALAKDNMSFAKTKIDLQTAERNEAIGTTAAAVSAGNLDAVVGFYNRYVPDGAEVTGISQDPKTGAITVNRKGADGQPLAPQTIKSRDELLAGLTAFKDPMALYNFSLNQFHRDVQERADKRAGAAETRAQQVHNTNMQDRADKRKAGEDLYRERNPNATPAELAAVRSGVMPVVPAAKDYKLEMSEVATAFGTPAVDSKGQPIMDLMTGRQAVNRDTAAEDKFFAWMKANNITDTNKGLLEYKALQSQGVAGGGALTFASEADAEAAAKSGKIKKGDRITIGGRSGTWQ